MSERNILCIIFAVLILIAIFVFRKALMKMLLCLAICLVGVSLVNEYAPDKVKTATAYAQHATEIVKAAGTSDKIKIEKKDGKIEDIQVKLNDKWYSLDDVEKMKKNLDGGYTLTVNGKAYIIDEEEVVNVLNQIKQYGQFIASE